jgi:hypothetical protein
MPVIPHSEGQGGKIKSLRPAWVLDSETLSGKKGNKKEKEGRKKERREKVYKAVKIHI